ncbi:hypothetical protein AGMMS50229_20050 [Campylobacterota bacterium]|nr:hypothetical protein AGMMS50229_20000 [Campylobacterota bacterium]GHV09599.1 hypothetical protein AGMMS50229_20050 [Campylobacterota bacterium]
MESWFFDVLLLFFVEVIEANLQKGNSFDELVTNLQAIWSQSPLRFWLAHYSFYLVIAYAVFGDHMNGFMLSIVLFKIADIAFKLRLFSDLRVGGSASTQLGIPNLAITPTVRYAGSVIYSAIFAIALTN